MNFFSSVFSAVGGDEREEERGEEVGEEGGGNEAAAAEEEGERAAAGGGWSFGGLIKTLAEEIEEQRKVNSQLEAEEAAAKAAAREEGGEEGEGEGSGGGAWSFGGLIQTLAEEIEEQRKANSQLEAESSAAKEAAAGEGEGDSGGGGEEWSFGGLIQTFATRLESVGQAVDDLGAAAAVLLTHANEALRSADAADGEDAVGDGSSHHSDSSGASWRRSSLPSKKYTRFEAQVLALRADPATFTEEPEDANGFAKWRDSFRIDERKEEIEGVLKESPGLESFVERLVPVVVEYDMFWCRYFFAVDKLRQAEDVRTKLVNRALSKEDEEELSWEVDDDDDDEADGNGDRKEGASDMVNKNEEQTEEPVSHKTRGETQEGAGALSVSEDKETTTASGKDNNIESKDEAVTPKSSNDMGQEQKVDAGDSSKESDFSVVSRPSVQEEDLSWEEIEDVGDEDEKKKSSPWSSPPSKVEDIRKRFSSVEDEEDLSWDIDE
uniref:BSD domain-containing protein n=1 Tax=Leersia perrieri TaxID=77586 RepID=A0A0D9UZJ5_9ORYZ